MPSGAGAPQPEKVNLEHLGPKFISLRVGEEIPRFEVKDIRKVVNKAAQNNLSGVDYRYVMEDSEGKLLTISSWALWKQISAVLQQAGSSKKVVLELKHLDIGKYSVRVL